MDTEGKSRELRRRWGMRGTMLWMRVWGYWLLFVLMVLGLAVILLFEPPGLKSPFVDSWGALMADAPRYLLHQLSHVVNGGMAQFSINHLSVFLALMPSFLAFGYFALGRKRQLHARRETLLRYLRFRHDVASYLSEGKPFFIEDDTDEEEEDARSKRDRVEDQLKAHRAYPGEYFFSALVLAMPFLGLAALSDAITHGNETFVPALRFQAMRPEGALEYIDEGIRGIVFTGYGVFTYTIVVLIHRVHALALSTEFLLSATLRATLMMVIGFAIGLTGIFFDEASRETSNPGIFMYFAVGAFPAWGYEFIRRKAREVLLPHATQTNSNLSLEHVEGMDEATIERLEEVNISNVQHLSTVDPVELTLKTLYPFHRVIDWIDQAILITYLREHIGAARKLGIRGAIDMRGLFILARSSARPVNRPPGASTSAGPVAGEENFFSKDPSVMANETLRKLAAETRLDPATVYIIGTNLVDDFYVQLLGMLWHHWGVRKPTLRPAVINAIHAAMQARGMSSRPAPGEIPPGECKVSLDAAFDEALRKELSKLSVTWEGHVGALRRTRWLRDVYEAILRHVQVKGAPEVNAATGVVSSAAQPGPPPPVTPAPPGPPSGPPPRTQRKREPGRFRQTVKGLLRRRSPPRGAPGGGPGIGGAPPPSTPPPGS